MSVQLTKRALRVFAVLENYREGSADILDALLPFFEPILSEFPDSTLDSAIFAVRVNEAYRWNFTADIVEELIPRFAARGWVKKIGGSEKDAAYKITYDKTAFVSPAADDIAITQTLITLSGEFEQFVQRLSPLTKIAIPSPRFADILIEWLVSIDAYSEDILREKALQITNVAGQLNMTVEVSDTSSLSSEEKYLCARFVKELFANRSPYTTDLCKLASVGLLTEVIQDFQKPTTKVKKTDLCVYLDAPVALDLLGVSGKEASANIRPIVTQLQSIGGIIRIFRASVQELQGALDAVLRRSPAERVGATAGALRRNEVVEAYVRQVARDPETLLSNFNVAVIERKLDQFPNEKRFFDQAAHDQFFSTLKWHLETARRDHDATIVTNVMRMRRGAQSRDIFQSKHLLVTRNALLNESAKAFCRKQGISSLGAIGPAVHQRQIATAIWLRTGLSQDQEDIPKRYLLAACERVLELRKNVADQVRQLSKTITPEKAEQLDLLLTQDRSTQLLMDKTLGSSNVVNAQNIESLIDEMKRTLAREAEAEKLKAIAEKERTAMARVKRANERLKIIEQKNMSLKQSLSASEGDDQLAVDALVSEVNWSIQRRWLIVRASAGLLVIATALLPIVTELFSGWMKFVSLSTSGALAALFLLPQMFDRQLGLRTRIVSWATRRTHDLAERRGLKAKLSRFELRSEGGIIRAELIDSSGTTEVNSPVNLLNVKSAS